ncbi:MAG: PAS domain-containing protein [Rhodobacteraceae bacterium]|nr:PAS domain-containing protein [Paracoccaceae bacterium]
MTDFAFDHAPVGLAVLDKRIVRRCNLHFARIFEASVEDLTNLPISELYPSRDDFNRIGERLQQMETGIDYYSDERIMRRRSGELFWCRVRGQSVSSEAPFTTGVWSFADLSDDRPVVSLTPRERDVAILTCRGLSAKEIGVELKLSYRTVETHRAHLLEKFGARKLPELVAKLSGMPL